MPYGKYIQQARFPSRSIPDNDQLPAYLLLVSTGSSCGSEAEPLRLMIPRLTALELGSADIFLIAKLSSSLGVIKCLRAGGSGVETIQ